MDPIDGTREFVAGLDEFSISVALAVRGRPVLAVVYNPAREEFFHAEAGRGSWLNGHRIHVADRQLRHATEHEHGCLSNPLRVLASRTELARGDFEAFATGGIQIIPCGSIAYKLAQVAAGRAEVTWSLGPKHEWDIAAGVLLVEEAGGRVSLPDGRPLPPFNAPVPRVPGILAGSPWGWEEARRLIAQRAGQRLSNRGSGEGIE